MRWNRVLHKSSSLTDYTVQLNDPFVGSSVSLIVLATDYIYFGSELPFNHKYFQITTPNIVVSAASIQYWDGDSWQDAIDVIDETSLNGATLGQSGRISWATNPRVSSWGYDDTELMTSTDLINLKINGLYWARMKVSVALTNPIAINFVGQKFSEDSHLFQEYPELEQSTLISAYKTGKTNWTDQTLVAAQYISKDLIDLGVIKVRDQILDWDIYQKASVHKTAAIIYSAFGDDYKDDLAKAEKKYRENLKVRVYRTDQDKDANLSVPEKVFRRMEFMSR